MENRQPKQKQQPRRQQRAQAPIQKLLEHAAQEGTAMGIFPPITSHNLPPSTRPHTQTPSSKALSN
jgi:hypothetical protein